MAALGSYLLLTAFVVCAYAASISIAGARRRSRRLIESGVGAFYLTSAVMVAASAVMIYSFVTGDYTIQYVQHYLGFVGLTIPYAFGMAALITGHLDDSWLRAVRRWTMMAWLCLSIGLCLGMIWAYEGLGWGGYWGWDPVENAGLLPWFTATAFLHSVMVQERRSMLRVWNVTLVILTFFLTIFGTFMTRSGVVQSVHAFGSDPILARMFTTFMVSI